MKFARVLALVAALSLVLVACAPDGQPEGFDDQPTEVDPELAEALGLDADATLPITQLNFLEGCVQGEAPRVDGLDAADRAAACQCSYDGIVAFYLDTANGDTDEAKAQDAFSAFKALDDDLSSETGTLPANIMTIFDGCR